MFFGRRFIAPIFQLQRATQGVASGDLETRVHIDTGDEFSDLGQAFNTMADRLIQLQEDVKKQERQAMFGRVAAGLVHDLSHPIQNIGNSTRLLLRDDLDQESRNTFHRTIERELQTLKHFMDDLRNIVKPKPIERFPMDVNGSLAEIVDAMKFEGDRNGVAVEAHYAQESMTIEGDKFALGRVYRNLITNGIQATQPGGRIVVTTARVGDWAEVTVRRHRLGHPAGAAGRHLRRLRHDQAPRPRPRPGDLEADRRAAGRHDHGRERSGQGHGVHAALPGPREPSAQAAAS